LIFLGVVGDGGYVKGISGERAKRSYIREKREGTRHQREERGHQASERRERAPGIREKREARFTRLNAILHRHSYLTHLK
jgi:hypothetical protein